MGKASILRRRNRCLLVAGLAAALLAGRASADAAVHAAAPTAVVATVDGKVQGTSAQGVDRFLGMPYAAPPVGPLRWRPPQAPASWSGIRQATRFAPFCPQLPRGVFASPSTSEDCLYLNVFAPAHSEGRHLPVMVWFYGGGLFSGESNDYDGSKLARRGRTIVVTLNYRIGALGFLSQPALNAEGHPYANYGLMDQQYALRWVRRNIARFGGDPGKVTIFGQSGGATAVMAQLVSPTAAGLFQRAIVESGTHIKPYPAVVALQAGEDFARAAGCPDQDAACLRALSVRQVLGHQAGVVKHVVVGFPTVDGTVVTHDAYPAFRAGQFNKVPILAGLTEDEQAFFLPEANGGAPLDAAGYERYLKSFGAEHAAELERHYPLSRYASPSLAEIAAAQGFKVCTSRRLYRAWSRYVPVYAYQFDDRRAPTYFPPLSYPMRAYHTSELQYLFPLFHGGQGTPHPLSASQSRLSDAMVDDWTSFARLGVPQAAGQPAWLRYTAADDNVLTFTPGAIRISRGYGTSYDCALWDRVLHR